jgi:very-short-patch-repair endonuclease
VETPTTPAHPRVPSARRPGDECAATGPVLPLTVRFTEERRAELARRTDSGSLERVRRGVYLPLPAAADRGPAESRREHVLRQVAAVAERLTTTYWFSHTSAALLHGCWTWQLADVVHVTQLRAPKGAQVRERRLRRHWTTLPQRDRTEVLGLPVTTLERNVVDCARSIAGAQALVVADSGLRAGADIGVIQAILEEAAGARGVRRARSVVALADARAESPGESIVRWIVHEADLPAPTPGFAVDTRLGRRWLDLAWPELKVAIEFDGAVKYTGGEFGDAGERLWREKRRHDALVEAGWVVLRVVWADLAVPEVLVRRVREAMRRRL